MDRHVEGTWQRAGCLREVELSAAHPPLGMEPAPTGMSTEECRLRCQLAACYQLTDLYGMSWIPGIGRISRSACRGRGITSWSIRWAFCSTSTPPALLKVDIDARVVDGDPSLLNPAGFIIHSAIHMAQTDLVASCIHTRGPTMRWRCRSRVCLR